MVYMDNCTVVTQILLTGFYYFQGFRIPMFLLFLTIYILVCGENVFILYVISRSARLKALMFFIIQSMCVSDLLNISNFIPKFLNDVLSERPTITVSGCIVQLQVYGTTADAIAFHYVLMSYDRYLAVCHPLRYSSFVNIRIYLHIIITCWIFSTAATGVISVLQYQLRFCGGNTIHHFFCDSAPFMDLATSNTIHIQILTVAVSAFMILMTFSSFFITYMLIIRTILRISSSSGRRKAFSTCSSHLIVFSMQYGLAFIVYVLPAKVLTPQITNTYLFINFIWTPMVNPLIYTFNSQEFREEYLKKIKKRRTLRSQPSLH